MRACYLLRVTSGHRVRIHSYIFCDWWIYLACMYVIIGAHNTHVHQHRAHELALFLARVWHARVHY